MKHNSIEEWYVLFNQDIYNYLIYYTGHYDVEDLVQDTFAKALKSMSLYSQQSTPKAWLISIARNTAIDYFRRKRMLRMVPDEILKFFTSIEKSPDEVLVLEEEIALLYEMINRLKNKYRDVIILKDINHLTVSEIADILNWTESKVKITYHRAFKKLQESMVKRLEEGGIIYDNKSS